MFETVANGTLFLDEITSLDLSLQSTLLQVIQERRYTPIGSQLYKPFRANIIAASSKSITQAVEAGKFREDLYYRLYVVSLNLPPLRKRGNDIELLTQYFLKRFNKELRRHVHISSKGITAITEFSWPGNVRQLENFIQSVVAMCPSEEASESFIYKMLDERRLSSSHTRPTTFAIINAQDSFKRQESVQTKATSGISPLWQTEKMVIEDAINACEGNVVKAAKYLEVSPSTLYRKIQTWEQQNSRASAESTNVSD